MHARRPARRLPCSGFLRLVRVDLGTAGRAVERGLWYASALSPLTSLETEAPLPLGAGLGFSYCVGGGADDVEVSGHCAYLQHISWTISVSLNALASILLARITW